MLRFSFLEQDTHRVEQFDQGSSMSAACEGAWISPNFSQSGTITHLATDGVESHSREALRIHLSLGTSLRRDGMEGE
jgi:hypothetical protein